MISTALVDAWPSLISVYGACLVAFTSPGPNFVTVTSHAVASRGAGIGVAIGISVGTALWALLAAVGITALLSAYHDGPLVLGLIGGVYLCWLGIKSIRSVSQGAGLGAGTDTSGRSRSMALSVRTGLIIQMTNPKTALFWLALTSIAIRPSTPAEVVLALVFGCLIIALIWHVMLALAFSSGPVRDRYVKLKPAISTVFGVLFLGLGLRIIYVLMLEYFRR